MPTGEPDAASSCATVSLRATMALFDSEYAAMPGTLKKPAMEEVFTIQPSSEVSRMMGRNVAMPWTTPHTFTSITQRKSARVNWSNGAR